MALQDCIDAARACAFEAVPETRPHEVVVRVSTWSGGEPGRGTVAHQDTTITPRPVVRSPSARYLLMEAGKAEAGERVVEQISANYAKTALTGDPSGSQEVVWLINGDEYRLAAEPERVQFGWRVRLARMNRGRANR